LSKHGFYSDHQPKTIIKSVELRGIEPLAS
jgi:hypothetical protein